MPRTKPLQSPEYRLLVGRLVAARERAGLSQVEAARRLGQAQSYVAKCEGLYRRVDMLELLHFLRVYHVSAEEFFRPWTPSERRVAAALRERGAG